MGTRVDVVCGRIFERCLITESPITRGLALAPHAVAKYPTE